jgi:hypothetical protein
MMMTRAIRIILPIMGLPLIILANILDGRLHQVKAETACRPADVEVKGVRKITSPGPFVFVVGEVTNHCKVPAQAVITLTLRNSEGEIVDVIDWVLMERGPLAPGESTGTEANTASKIESAVRLQR